MARGRWCRHCSPASPLAVQGLAVAAVEALQGQRLGLVVGLLRAPLCALVCLQLQSSKLPISSVHMGQDSKPLAKDNWSALQMTYAGV
jgi:hypothetical protein